MGKIMENMEILKYSNVNDGHFLEYFMAHEILMNVANVQEENINDRSIYNLRFQGLV